SKQKAGTVLSVVSIDKAGNSSATVQVKVIDKTPPKAPTVNKVSNKTKYITGKAEPGAKVVVKKGSTKIGEVTASSSGKFTIKLKSYLKTGTTLTITAVDKSGNVSHSTTIKVMKG
ncbi:Ig-like domain-containing protein, partial [Gottfriedia acidiceleris]|uniref:Ig-like domain-containing protein n=1 Tax=Gottfriedia acidiceleris TaxID=371036 RepID=UPI002FFEE45C